MINVIKAILKQGFYKTGQAALLDKFIFCMAYVKNWKKNRLFRKKNPAISLPPDYFLYETYLLDYEEYLKDGETAAREIMEWVIPYMAKEKESWRVMEWGCGVGRIIRHMHAYVPNGTTLWGCDINQEMISWNMKHISGVSFKPISYLPPTNYDSEIFDMVYAISVFTHIDAQQQQEWIREIYRMIKKSGIFLFTTHVSHYFHQLLPNEKLTLDREGVFTRSYNNQGHRMMTTYNEPATFTSWLSEYFETIHFFEGNLNLDKIGGQDLWIVKRKEQPLIKS